jgi:hypothetical protein
MELNITIFIQALIFLMLFVFSSKFLFQPLRSLFLGRLYLTDNEEKEISILRNSIKQQQYYLHRAIFFIENKIRLKKIILRRNDEFRKRVYAKRITFKNEEKYKNITFKFKNEVFIVKKKIIKSKKNITKYIIKQLNNS